MDEQRPATSPIGTEENPLVVKPEKPFEKPEVLIKWNGKARVFVNRSAAWFVTFLLLAIIIVAVFMVFNNWSLALLVVAFTFMMFAMNLVEPNTRDYAVTTGEIMVGNKKYKYTDLNKFWFEEVSGQMILYVSTYLHLPHLIEIPLPQENANELREKIEKTLLKYLPYNTESRRDMYRVIDQVIDTIAPYLPKGVVDWYGAQFHPRS
jgi:hypothetical protein